jgi:hypothetical protein
MSGEERRQDIIRKLKSSTTALSGKHLATLYQVSRQVIVQDIALIRVSGFDIVSTNRGYLLNVPHAISRVFKVIHNDEQIEDELCSIIDLGGTVVDVFIWHKVYGKICCPLQINSRHKIAILIDDIQNGRSQPLKNITSSYHYHTIEAPDEETLDLIEKVLREKNYLIDEESKG